MASSNVVFAMVVASVVLAVWLAGRSAQFEEVDTGPRPPRVVLVTGGTGLVGSAIQVVVSDRPASAERWIFLSSKDGDLRDFEATRRIFAKYRPTHVVHLAAKVFGLFKNMKHKVEIWRDNVQINNNVLECGRQFNVTKLVSCLSTCIFPQKVTYPMDETMLHVGPPHPFHEAFGYAKRMIDMLNHAYHDEFGLNFTSVIPANIYGPHDNYNLEDSHVVPGLIHKFYLALKEGRQPEVMGTGKALRQFVFSEDIARLMVWALFEYPETDPIILSVGEEEEVTIKDVAETIARALKYDGPLKFDTTKSDGQLKKTASNAKLRKYLPDFKFTPMRDAMKRSVEWFASNYDIARK